METGESLSMFAEKPANRPMRFRQEGSRFFREIDDSEYDQGRFYSGFELRILVF